MVSYDKKDKYEMQRTKMIRHHLMGRDIKDDAVLEVLASIPRELFIPEKYADEAYGDYPIPIGIGQTISQPYIVALMTQCLRVNDQCDVLELGTGSGYQTAILAKLAKRVFTIERYNQLSESAQAVLANLGVNNVEFFIGDGSKGWPSEPDCPEPAFDRIIITAAIPSVPQSLVNQLKDKGLIVAPVGGTFSQDLMVIEKEGDQLYAQSVCPCRFVKLIGKYGFNE